ncbi:avidin/streptavidin family protein [uncultured Shewanella sp.]|uniref:avidin/streptavidin family protein n=1 Tax=uncultured Shewanella sp. TaxID=173975 RepID=UPI0026257080|nr:avidin/streptavidin family protein [uncultured Shewanella sp.]
MKKTTYLVFIVLSTSSFLTHAAKPNCDNLIGDWISDSQSTLTFSTIGKEGQLTGHYIPYQFAEKPAPLIGWSNTSRPKKDHDNVKVVSFSVNWTKHGAITSWSGTCSIEKGIPVIKAIANLARANSSFSWDHIITDSNRYTPK